MSNAELIAEARKGSREDRTWMIDIIERLTDALEKRAHSAHLSETGRELIKARSVITEAKGWECGNGCKGPSFDRLQSILSRIEQP